MSRVGNLPINLPTGVTIKLEGNQAEITGPKGTLTLVITPFIKVSVEDQVVKVARLNDELDSKAKHGLTRALLASMVEGVSKGYEKKLEVNGVGFKVALSGKNLKLALGYSHEIEFQTPEGISLGVDANTITITGADKQQVGEVAAQIRRLRKPEPYKGKGIKYVDEQIIKKAGKSAATATTSA